MTSPVRLGSIGLGWWGGVLAEAVSATGMAEVSACYARSEQSRQHFAAEYNCEPAESLTELLSGFDLDGVLIATPHTTHADLAVSAAQAGLHVFVDKPITLTVNDADRVIATADEAGVKLQVGHNRRRQPANRRIKELIASGQLGDVHHLEANHSAPLMFNPNLASWRRRAEESPVGGMTALGVHQVDTFQYLAGPIARVAVMSARLLPEGEIDDTSVINFEFESGALGQLVTSQATGPAVDVQVHGTDASARNLGDGSALTLQKRGSTEIEMLDVAQEDTILDEMTEFVRVIKGETKPETGGEVGRSVVAVLEAVIESAATKSFVEVVR